MMRLALAALAAAVLAGLAGVGVYAASQPAAKQSNTPIVNYGSRP